MRRDYFGGWQARETIIETVSPIEQYREVCSRAHHALAANRPSDAVTEARAALGVLPRGAEAQRLLGLALLELGETRPALNAFQSALAADPLDLLSQVGLAEAREILEGPGNAEDEWRRAWELDPSVPELGERYLQARRAAGALDVAPGLPPLTRAALARIQLRSGLFEHAASEARTVLTREPNRLDVQVTLAEAYWRAGDEETAAAVAGEILERQADCLVANLLLAAYWQVIGRDASALLARVMAVDPAGFVAARLFDDREAPWDLGQGPAEQWAQRATPTTPPAAPSVAPQHAPVAPVAVAPPPQADTVDEPEVVPEPLAQTQPLEPVHSTHEPESAAVPERTALEPAPAVPPPLASVQASRGPSALSQVSGPEAVHLVNTSPEPEPEAPGDASPTIVPDQPVAAIAVPDTIEQRVPAALTSEEPVAAVTPTELAPAEAVEAAPWREGPEIAVAAPLPLPAAPPESLDAIRRAADRAMRERRYLAAMHAYGTLIERLREAHVR